MATFVGVGFSEKNDPFLAAQEAAKLALYQLHHREISFGILFSTIQFADKRLLEGINYALGNIKILGSTGAGIITSSGLSHYGAGLMLVSSDKIKFGTAATHNIKLKGARAAGEDFAHQALKNLGTTQRDLALIFCDGLVENGSDLLRGIKDVLGLSFPIFGGSSADNFRFLRTFQYSNGGVSTDSLVGALFAGENLFGIGLRHGWKPLGKPRPITKVQGNIIKEIEGKPAVTIYEDYFGKPREEIKRSIIRMSTYYPLGLYVPGEAEYLLRNSIRVEDDGGLVCQGDAAEGAEARIMMGTKEWALDAATQAAQEAKQALEGKEIKGAIILESISRNKLLGRLTDKELSRIKEVLGDIPILGLSTYGEQAPLKSLQHYGETYFHNETVAILTIGESHAPHKLT
ncbi:MAG TPA: hypothetical protein DCL35_03415 [Candidatus Omnitrophica bacterium]|nr:hypothetical protein [Candidatus Omnitrophota bacterium]